MMSSTTPTQEWHLEDDYDYVRDSWVHYIQTSYWNPTHEDQQEEWNNLNQARARLYSHWENEGEIDSVDSIETSNQFNIFPCSKCGCRTPLRQLQPINWDERTIIPTQLLDPIGWFMILQRLKAFHSTRYAVPIDQLMSHIHCLMSLCPTCAKQDSKSNEHIPSITMYNKPSRIMLKLSFVEKRAISLAQPCVWLKHYPGIHSTISVFHKYTDLYAFSELIPLAQRSEIIPAHFYFNHDSWAPHFHGRLNSRNILEAFTLLQFKDCRYQSVVEMHNLPQDLPLLTTDERLNRSTKDLSYKPPKDSESPSILIGSTELSFHSRPFEEQIYYHAIGACKRYYFKSPTYDIEFDSFPYFFYHCSGTTTYQHLQFGSKFRHTPFTNIPKRKSTVHLSTYIRQRLRGYRIEFLRDHLYVFTLLAAKLKEAVSKRGNFWIDDQLRKSIGATDISETSLTRTQARKDLDSMIVNQLINLVRDNQNVCNHHMIRTVFETIPPFSPYFVRARFQLQNMISQMGIPCLFLTISLREEELFRKYPSIREVQHYFDLDGTTSPLQPDYGLTAEFGAQLFPIILNQFADHLKELGYPLRHFYERIEFQNRGTPHAHILLWCDNTPRPLEVGHMDQINALINEWEQFLSKLIFAQTDDNAIRSVQTHIHYARCQANLRNNTMCKWRFPRLPMRTSRLLVPSHPDSKDRQAATAIIYKWQHILQYKSSQLSEHQFDKLTFDQWLDLINVSSEDNYCRLISQSLTSPVYFTERRVQDARINDFNPRIIALTNANMDLTPITSIMQAINYVTKYVSKSEPTLLRDTALDKSRTITQALFHTQDLNLARRLSLQEATLTCQGRLPIRNTWQTLYLRPFSFDVQVTRPESVQQAQNIRIPYAYATIYMHRPESLQDLNLFEFTKSYSTSKRIRGAHKIHIPPNKNTYITKRSEETVVTGRFPHTLPPDFTDTYLPYYFLPWRDPHELQQFGDYDSDIQRRIIDTAIQCRPYDPRWQQNSITYDTDDEDAPDEDKQPDKPLMDSYIDPPFDISDSEQENDPSDDQAMLEMSSPITSDLHNSKLTFSQFRVLLEFHKWVHDGRTTQLLWLIHGKGGTGKSFLINTIRNLCRKLDQNEGRTRDQKSMCHVVAPTGTAAYLVGGDTIHKFSGLSYRNMIATSRSVWTNLHNNASHLELLLIDEISMVSTDIYANLNMGLKNLGNYKTQHQRSLPFGGVNVIAFGDFDQLPPVKAKSLDENHHFTSLFSRFDLTENVRHGQDLHLQQLLAALTSCDHHIVANFIESHRGTDEDLKSLPFVLFCRNQQRDIYNQHRVDQLPGRPIKILTHTQDRDRRRGSNRRAIIIKKNAKAMLTTNLNVSKGHTNGTLGIIKSSVKHEIILKLPNRSRCRVLPHADHGVRKYPLDLAWGLTVHKAQGRTLNHRYGIYLNHLNYRYLYVACGRATRMDHIRFFGTLPGRATLDKSWYNPNKLPFHYWPTQIPQIVVYFHDLQKAPYLLKFFLIYAKQITILEPPLNDLTWLPTDLQYHTHFISASLFRSLTLSSHHPIRSSPQPFSRILYLHDTPSLILAKTKSTPARVYHTIPTLFLKKRPQNLKLQLTSTANLLHLTHLSPFPLFIAQTSGQEE